MSDQSESSTVYNILAFAFEGQHTAKKIVKEIKSSGALKGYDIVAQAVVEKTDKGKVKVHEPGRGGVGAAVGRSGRRTARPHRRARRRAGLGSSRRRCRWCRWPLSRPAHR